MPTSRRSPHTAPHTPAMIATLLELSESELGSEATVAVEVFGEVEVDRGRVAEAVCEGLEVDGDREDETLALVANPEEEEDRVETAIESSVDAEVGLLLLVLVVDGAVGARVVVGLEVVVVTVAVVKDGPLVADDVVVTISAEDDGDGDEPVAMLSTCSGLKTFSNGGKRRT
eukprot:m.632818 g.632818  ORF g.632818 m.632818 type:complete len:172 (-) comp58294_c0_seq19:1578-2093(-)